MDQPQLVVLSGRPGTGKTTLAKLLAPRLGAAHLRIDAIAGRHMRGGLTNDPLEAGRVAYEVAHEVATDILQTGIAVIVDGVHATHARRAAWREVKQGSGGCLVMVETILNDPDEHRRRVEARRSRGSGYMGPSWASIESLIYNCWDEELDGSRIVVEMSDAEARLPPVLNDIRRPAGPRATG